MDRKDLVEAISKKDFDVAAFVQLAIEDEKVRDELISHMLHNADIMVYYHCYEVASRASQAKPELFYPYWPQIAALLDHPNSYHRDFALTILANLARVDQQDQFAALAEKYLEHINDAKFCTGQYCVRNCKKILAAKPDLTKLILDHLLDLDARCDYPPKQLDLLKFDVLEVLEQVYGQAVQIERMHAFILSAAQALSPKTRKKARALIKEYGL